jgi:hypothetical protein
MAIYYARDEKTSETLAELKIIVGQLERKTDSANQTVGVQCELKSFIVSRADCIGALYASDDNLIILFYEF